MLSILIPIYAYDVSQLVCDLHQQAMSLDIDWEIRLLDDASDENWLSSNRKLASLPNVYYQELNQNIGRAAIRNRLAEQACYDFLLFMDCDSGVDYADFLQTYCEQLSPVQVLCGGRSYQSTLAPLPFRLHWHYGCQREVRSARERNKRPYDGFMTNNFVVPKTVYQSIKLDERLKQYGHEDTLFGLELEKAGVAIKHINNPLLHLGLESASSWLNKQQQAIQNLYQLYLENPHLHTRALRTWRLLHRTGLLRIRYAYWQRKAVYWQQQLVQSTKPRLRMLDALKVFWLEEAHRGRYSR